MNNGNIVEETYYENNKQGLAREIAETTVTVTIYNENVSLTGFVF